jgi:hypothetical protein
MTPWFALFWKMNGPEHPGWTCVGLYETEDEADEAFHNWDTVYDGLLVKARVDQMNSRGVGPAYASLAPREEQARG